MKAVQRSSRIKVNFPPRISETYVHLWAVKVLELEGWGSLEGPGLLQRDKRERWFVEALAGEGFRPKEE